MSKVVLDTNAYTNLLKGDIRVLELLTEASEIFISVIVLGELYAGFKGGTSEKKNLKTLNSFLNKRIVSCLDVTKNTAIIFSEIKQQLKSRGKPIPINDVWIASHTIETGSRIITFDQHFQAIEGLRIADLG